MQSVREFYNDYTKRQLSVGIHHRHLSIQRWLERFGLQKDSKVLEIGMGIGTQTELLLRYLNSTGFVYGIDISDESVKAAKRRLEIYSNKYFECNDILDSKIEDKFDVILLPDVIEHIPLIKHKELFHRISLLLKKTGFILIHIPAPFHLEWIQEHRKEELQIVDQAIHTDLILNSLKDTDLYLFYLETYSIFNDPEDYQIIILKNRPNTHYERVSHPVNDSLFRRISRKVRFVLRGGK